MSFWLFSRVTIALKRRQISSILRRNWHFRQTDIGRKGYMYIKGYLYPMTYILSNNRKKDIPLLLFWAGYDILILGISKFYIISLLSFSYLAMLLTWTICKIMTKKILSLKKRGILRIWEGKDICTHHAKGLVNPKVLALS
jgi:hypothetical protein